MSQPVDSASALMFWHLEQTEPRFRAIALVVPFLASDNRNQEESQVLFSTPSPCKGGGHAQLPSGKKTQTCNCL